MKTLSIILLILMIASCSVLPESPPSAMHDLGYATTAPESTAKPWPLSQQARVTVEAPKWLADTHIRYRLLYAAPTQVRFYTLDRWIAPPSELFEQLLNSKEQWPAPVFIKLKVFEQQFDSPNKAKVLLHFTATVMPDGSQQKSKTWDFNLQLPCQTPDAKGAVTAFNLLTKQAVDKVQAWLAEVN